MNRNRTLSPEHSAELSASGWNEKTKRESGFYTETDATEISRILHWPYPATGLGPCLVIPFRRPDGTQNGFARIKPSRPLLDENGKPRKYEQPKGESNRVLFTPLACSAINDTSVVIAITEGDKKGWSIHQCGIAALGLCGIWNWTKKDSSPRQLCDDLLAVNWKGRRVAIVFDTDERRNPNVNHAAAELARVLTEHGAKVFIVTLPIGPADADGKPKKMAADDFIFQRGEQAFRELIAARIGPSAPAVALGDYRSEMQRARLESLDRKGGGAIFTDYSPAGSGKSFCDREAAAKAETSLTVTPTHVNAKSVEAFYCESGLNAAAYPQLTQKVCQNFETASRAIESGLSASSAVCPACQFRHACDYRDMLSEAEIAKHRIATHKRAELSFSTIAKRARYIPVHEDAIGMLRPVAEVSGGFGQVAAVAAQAKENAIMDGDITLRHFFYQMEMVALDMEEKLSDALDTSPLTATVNAGHPPNVDSRLFASMTSLGVFPAGDAVRIVVAAVVGDLAELVVRVDRVFARATADKPAVAEVRRSIVAAWNTKIPSHAIVWFSDATADPEEIESVISAPVFNGTPAGRVEMQHPVCQLPVDVKQSTSPAVVAKILAGVLARFSDAKKVGVILHRCHLAVPKGTSHRGKLPSALVQRIVRVEHFRSGESRGSNDWLDSCDLLIVLGTPRVPPAAVKLRLIRTGRIAAAGRDGGWSTDYWSGETADGTRKTIKTGAYRDHAWNAAYRAVVRAELIQCAGRGRALCENGVPVVVVSNESLSLPILNDSGLETMSENQLAALEVVFELSAQKSKRESENADRHKTLIYILGFCAVSSILVGNRLGWKERYSRGILTGLRDRGYVEQVGKRGGWKITSAGVALISSETPTPTNLAGGGAAAGLAAAGPGAMEVEAA